MYTSIQISDSEVRAQAYDLAIKCKATTVDMPNAYAIDLDGLEDIDLMLGEDKMTPKQNLDSFFEKGVLVYRSMKSGMPKQDCPIIALGKSEKVIDSRPIAEIAEEIYQWLIKGQTTA